MVISGKELAAACKAKMAEQVKTFPEKYGRLPHLVVVLVGEDAGSVSYVTGKTKAADEVGILNTTIRKPADISEEELLKIIDDLNADDTVDGILIQLPLPKHIDSDKVIARIRQEKDVDGFHPLNVAALWQKQPCVLPCTPKGIMKLLKDSGVELAGRGLSACSVRLSWLDAGRGHEFLSRHGQVARAMPAGRCLGPDDVLPGLCFLLSAEAAAINGSVVTLDGGLGALKLPEL